jgi:hypothetical protein
MAPPDPAARAILFAFMVLGRGKSLPRSRFCGTHQDGGTGIWNSGSGRLHYKYAGSLEKGHTQTMSHSQPSMPAMFTQVDVTAGRPLAPSHGHVSQEQTSLLRDVLSAQDRTNELLEELVSIMATSHKQRMQELHQWKNANPRLSESCREAAELLSHVQVDYLERMTEEINDTAEDMEGGDYMVNEFVDRFGPRLAHLNGVIQVLAQLGSPNTPAPVGH